MNYTLLRTLPYYSKGQVLLCERSAIMNQKVRFYHAVAEL